MGEHQDVSTVWGVNIKWLITSYHHDNPILRYQYIIPKTVLVLVIYIYIWLSYNDLTATSLGIMVSKGNDLQMALIQVSEIL